MTLKELLDQAIGLREAGQPEASLKLLNHVAGIGLHNGWLEDNRARALLALNRTDEAQTIWKELLSDPDPALKQASEEMLEQLELFNKQRAWRTALLEECQRLDVNPGPLKDEENLERGLLEEAISLREAGQPEASLKLLNHSVELGLRNGWLEDNRARALLALNRTDEAQTIWESLRDEEDPTLRRGARKMLEQLDLDVAVPDLLTAVKALAIKHDWRLKRLSSDTSNATSFEFELLEEAVIARECGNLVFSQELVELALKSGFSSPWLEDNLARALLAQDKVIEACVIWRKLANESSQQDVRSSATSMLRLSKSSEQKAIQSQQELKYLETANQHLIEKKFKQAIDILIESLFVFPKSNDCEEALEKILIQRRTSEDIKWAHLSPWLQKEEIHIEKLELILSDLEKRKI